jgi:hypothetical protein
MATGAAVGASVALMGLPVGSPATGATVGTEVGLMGLEVGD